jgi:arylsulfatase A-like enzyme
MLAAIILAAQANAECTTTAEAREVRKAARTEMRCRYKRLKDGPAAPCTLAPAPACAETLVGDTVTLAYGVDAGTSAAAVDPSAVRDQLRCQRFIGTASARFIAVKLRYLVRGFTPAEAEARPRRKLDKLPDKCAVTVADSNGTVVPAVGAQVAAAVGGVGNSVDAASLRDALVTLLEVWVDRVGPSPVPLRPNIVLILTDDQRGDTITTQFMPKLNAELVDSGALFPSGFAPNPVCCPSRASILSGQHAHTHGVLQNREGDPMNPTGSISAFADVSTVATWLHDLAGYRTGLFGKYLNGYRQFSDDYAATHGGLHYVAPGWDRWYAIYRGGGQYGITFIDETGVEIDTDPGTCLNPPPGQDCVTQPLTCPHSTDHLRDKALQFIDESVNLGEPFFLYLSTQSPHGPACPATRHEGTWAALPPHRPPNYDEGGVGADPDADKPGWLQQQGPIDAAGIDAFRIRQLESLLVIDDAVEAVMQKLRDTNQDDNTIVVYFGDNGYLWGEHRRDKKSCPYEECIHVPFVVRYPTLVPLPRTEARFVANIDLAPTFAELAGLDPLAMVPAVDGVSMVRLLDGTTPSWRTEMLGEHWGSAPNPGDLTPPIPTFALARGPQWKYTEYCTGERELYDLTQDPFELLNVAASHPIIVGQMAAALQQLRPGWPNSIPFACGVFDDDDEDE